MYLFTTNMANYIEPVDYCIFACHTRKFCCRVQIRLASMGETVFEFSHHHLSLSRSVCHIRRLSQQNEFQCRTVSITSPAHSAIQCDTVQCCMSVISPAHSAIQCDTVQCCMSVISPAHRTVQCDTVQCCMSVISPAHSRVEYSTMRYSAVLYVCNKSCSQHSTV